MLDFIEPKPSNLLISITQVIFPIYIKARYGQLDIKVAQDVMQAFQTLKGKSTIICPNHSAAKDSDVLFGISAIVGEQFRFLTAREIYWCAKWCQT